MNRQTYSESLFAAHVAATTVRRLPLADVLAAIEHAEAFAPVVDPTLWIKNGEKLRQDKAVVEILRDAQRKLESLHAPERAGFLTRSAPMIARCAARADERVRRPYSVEQADARGDRNGDPSRVVLDQAVV